MRIIKRMLFFTNHVEAASILVVADEVLSDFDVLAVEDAGRTVQEPEKLGVGVSALDGFIDSDYHIVATGSLSSGQDDTNLNSHF